MRVVDRRQERPAGFGPRREAQLKTVAYFRERRIWFWSVGLTALLVGLVFATSAVQEALSGRPLSTRWTFFLLGAAVASVPWMMWTVATSVDGSATWRIGAVGEELTAKELGRLGGAWRIEHNVPSLDARYKVDIDHIAIGPYGVLAVETKWTSDVVELGARPLSRRVVRATNQARTNAKRLRELLRREDPNVRVVPVVVYWGPNVTPSDEAAARIAGVWILAGGDADRWRPCLAGGQLEREAIDRLHACVRGWRAEREDRSVDAEVQRYTRTADRLTHIAWAVLTLLVLGYMVSALSAPLDRFLGSLLRSGGMAVGLALFLMPVVASLVARGLVQLARRLDPVVPTTRYWLPLAAWAAAFLAASIF